MISTSLLPTIVADIINLTYYLFKNLLGTVRHPYLTWRRISREPHLTPTIILLSVAILIFNFRSPIKFGLPDRPINILTQISANTFSVLFGYSITVFIIHRVSQFFTKTKITDIFTVWIYSYLPTVLWFLATQFFYLLLPPPRSTHLLGIIFTAFYLSFSISLLAWKLLLLWLTNQIVCQLSPSDNFKASLIIILCLTNLAFIFYKLGFWGIPFL